MASRGAIPRQKHTVVSVDRQAQYAVDKIWSSIKLTETRPPASGLQGYFVPGTGSARIKSPVVDAPTHASPALDVPTTMRMCGVGEIQRTHNLMTHPPEGDNDNSEKLPFSFANVSIESSDGSPPPSITPLSPLKLRVSIGDGDHVHSDGLHVRLLFENANKIIFK
ncbi:hypothetical protein EVAR_76528_1 [Eumeta japonica]|uniref:Uncharacterized protein n=1 Tax=Eumeta variegata TaxID=151549 RepID=A0A4C1T7Q8_EUMVA|nr:hypothetical protein EVAR_76528_1 [Eumeta japonica]